MQKLGPGTNRPTTDKSQQAAVISLLELLEAAGFQARLVGGCVRDRLLGLTPKDFDVATNAMPEQVIVACNQQGLRTIPIGIKHGTVTVITSAGPVEVTTLRRDVETDGRRAVVEFAEDFAVDASRRDFTINAMYEDRHGTLFDYFGGQQDVKDRRLVFVGSPHERIVEDYLRIMRYFRFRARFNFGGTQEALAAITKERDGLKKVSTERITGELVGIFVHKGIGALLQEMLQSGVLQVLLPSTRWKDKAIQAQFLAVQAGLDRVAGEFRAQARIAGYGLVLGLSGDDAERVLESLRLPKKDHKRIRDSLTLTDIKAVPNGRARQLLLVDALEDGHGHGSFVGFFAPLWLSFAEATGNENLERKVTQTVTTELKFGFLRRAKMPITGRDLPDTVLGKDIGRALHSIRVGFLNGDWHSRQDGLAFLRSLGFIS